MKYIIDMIDDMRENIQNSKDYTLLAMLLKEESPENFKNAGEKVITSLHVDHGAKQLQLGFVDENATTKELLEYVDSLEMNAMMYEVMVKISDEHPLMNVIGFGENHEQKQYTFFVTV
jgi:ethanolamine utilization protein EutA (predicted chaperonin)